MSIRSRLTFLYSMILALILVVFGIVLYIAVSNITYDSTASALESEVTSFSAVLAHPDPDQGGISIMPPRNSPPPELYTEIRQVNGSVVYQSPALQAAHANLPLDAALLKQVQQDAGSPSILAGQGQGQQDAGPPSNAAHRQQNTGPSPVDQTAVTVGGRQFLLCSAPIFFHGNAVGIVQIARPLQDVNQTLSILRIGLLLGGVVGILLACGAGWLLAGAALRPINQITATAQEIGAAQDFGRRVDYTGPADEVGRLAATFNTMLERLQSAYQAQRRFVSDASHELRTPLTTIRGNLGLLQREPPITEADRVAVIDDLVSESERLSRLIADLLTLARSDAGRPLRQEPVPLAPLIGDVVRRLGVLHPERILQELQPEALALGDRDALTQVLLILLDNALKFTPPEGTVTITTAAHADQVVLQVKDSGVGIAPDALPHIFERFYQGDTARTGTGTGLGLAIARAMVEGQHGSIAVASRPGQGSTFTVTLPRARVI
jgi:signal transduction histidine kinase